MTITTSAAVAEYGAAVRAAVAKLAPGDDGVLDGLDEHLAEVAAENDAPLTEVLGPPERYAADLVASTVRVRPGMPTAPPASAATEPVPGGPAMPTQGGGDAGPLTRHGAGVTDPVTADGRRVLWARSVLGAAIGLTLLVVARASSPLNPLQLMAAAGLVGGGWLGVNRLLPRADLPSDWGRWVRRGSMALALLVAVLLGGLMAGSTVHVVNGGGPPSPVTFGGSLVVVPSVLGLAGPEAVDLLRRSGLAVEEARADQVVVGQEPPAGVRVARGTMTALYLAPAGSTRASSTTSSPTETAPAATAVTSGSRPTGPSGASPTSPPTSSAAVPATAASGPAGGPVPTSAAPTTTAGLSLPPIGPVGTAPPPGSSGG